MAKHCCPRCGFESGHDSWHDRNPIPTVLLALPLTIFCIGALLAYPWFLIPVLMVVCALLVDRRQRRRAAIAARADYDYRQHMAALAWTRPTRI